MLDMATSDDANDWPWGNDLLRQGEKERGKESDRVLRKYQATATYKKETQRMLCKYHITYTLIIKVRLLSHRK